MSSREFYSLAFFGLFWLMFLGWGIGRFLDRTMDARPWDYGTLLNDVARRHRRTGAVEFILHRKGRIVGDYTYKADWWFRAHEDHWKNFEPYDDRNSD
jgi:hypothetical protein